MTISWLTFDHERVGLDLLTGRGDCDHIQGKFPLQYRAMMSETLPKNAIYILRNEWVQACRFADVTK